MPSGFRPGLCTGNNWAQWGHFICISHAPFYVFLDKYTLIEANRTRTVYNWLQYFSPEVLEKEFVECGFKVEVLYSDVSGSLFDIENDELAVIAKKI
jgi:hypothetical protein